MNRFRTLSAALALLTISTVISQEPTYSFKRATPKDSILKFKLQGDIEVQGLTVGLTSTITEKVVSVETDGSYKISESQSDTKVTVNGAEQDVPDQGGEVTTTYSATGDVLDIKSDKPDTNQYRLSTLQLLHAPDAPVKVNDAWNFKVKADPKGVTAANCDYKVLGVEKVGAKDAVKISATIKETEGTDAASSQGTIWLDPADFSILKSESNWTNVPLTGAPAPISGKITLTRQ